MKINLYYFIFFYSFFKIHSEININETKYHQYEICSYNGEPTITSDGGVICKCSTGYETDKTTTKKILGEKVQCSYRKKKRYVAFFLALFIPLGFDYLYLGKYWTFAILLIAIVAIITNAAICFIYINNFKSEPTILSASGNGTNLKHNIRSDSQRGSDKMQSTNHISFKEENDNDCKCCQFYQTINFILIGMLIMYWIINSILMGMGKINDSKGFETEDDLSYLFSVRK